MANARHARDAASTRKPSGTAGGDAIKRATTAAAIEGSTDRGGARLVNMRYDGSPAADDSDASRSSSCDQQDGEEGGESELGDYSDDIVSP